MSNILDFPLRFIKHYPAPEEMIRRQLMQNEIARCHYQIDVGSRTEYERVLRKGQLSEEFRRRWELIDGYASDYEEWEGVEEDEEEWVG